MEWSSPTATRNVSFLLVKWFHWILSEFIMEWSSPTATRNVSFLLVK
jgi:hypothetical protein